MTISMKQALQLKEVGDRICPVTVKVTIVARDSQIFVRVRKIEFDDPIRAAKYLQYIKDTEFDNDTEGYII